MLYYGKISVINCSYLWRCLRNGGWNLRFQVLHVILPHVAKPDQQQGLIGLAGGHRRKMCRVFETFHS